MTYPVGMFVRERLWLLAHDEQQNLTPLLDPRALEIGLMAATLVDLLLDHQIVIDNGHIRRDGRPRPSNHTPRTGQDSIANGVLREITGYRSVQVDDVLRAARADIPELETHPFVGPYQRTFAALIADGVVTCHRRTFRATRYELADAGPARWNRNRFTDRLVYPHGRGDPSTDSLCALVWGLNLHARLVTPYPPNEAGQVLRTVMDTLLAHLGPHSPLSAIPHLADSVRDAVGDLATAPF